MLITEQVDSLNIVVFWAVALCFWYRCSEWTCCFYIQGRKGLKSGHQVAPECWYLSTKLCGTTSQKTVVLIFASMRTSSHMHNLSRHASYGFGKFSSSFCILWYWCDKTTLQFCTTYCEGCLMLNACDWCILHTDVPIILHCSRRTIE
jgi:hypothetical protein